MKKFLTYVFTVVLLSQIAFATHTGHIKLLAVSTDGKNQTGSVADLFLDIKPGSGRVFIDTYPLSKLDTQFSTRFAKSVACDIISMDCSNRDFFYTIMSKSAIVGGPSAGAAVTILTISELLEFELEDDFAVTGTINSGGIIGPVGGIIAKAKAAQKAGLKKVVIPALSIGNNTEIEEYIKNASISVVRVSSVDEALYNLTGEMISENKELVISSMFVDTMKDISEILCDATSKLIVNNTNTSEEIEGKRLYERAKNATQKKTYYSAASFCFGANVKLRKLDLKNKSNDELIIVYNQIKNDIEEFEQIVGSIQLKTISDLQTYMIVKERLLDAGEYVFSLDNLSNISFEKLAYSIERYNSAITWSRFFGSGKKELVIDNDTLKNTCISKIAEVQEFLQYIGIYTSVPLERTLKNIRNAEQDLINGNYELCIFKASKAKAESSLVLEALSISKDQMEELIDEKLIIAKKNIVRAQEKDVFPILGYSYFEYAKSLKSFDLSSSLLYVGYSNELSNLDAYFEKKKGFSVNIDYYMLGIFLTGLLFGILLSLSIRKKR